MGGFRLSMGLDKPFLVQYGNWLTNVLHGDLGDSFSKSLPVVTVLLQRLAPTVKMAVFSMVLMLIISAILGGLGILGSVLSYIQTII